MPLYSRLREPLALLLGVVVATVAGSRVVEALEHVPCRPLESVSALIVVDATAIGALGEYRRVAQKPHRGRGSVVPTLLLNGSLGDVRHQPGGGSRDMVCILLIYLAKSLPGSLAKTVGVVVEPDLYLHDPDGEGLLELLLGYNGVVHTEALRSEEASDPLEEVSVPHNIVDRLREPPAPHGVPTVIVVTDVGFLPPGYKANEPLIALATKQFLRFPELESIQRGPGNVIRSGTVVPEGDRETLRRQRGSCDHQKVIEDLLTPSEDTLPDHLKEEVIVRLEPLSTKLGLVP